MNRVPKRFQAATIEGLDPAQFDMVVAYTKKVWRAAGVGLLLSGPPGVGKTWAVAALTLHAVQDANKKKRHFDYVFVTAPQLFDLIPVGGGPPFYDERRGCMWEQTLTKVPWLVINDLGKEYRAGKLHDQVVWKLGMVLRARSEARLVTHITTNLPLKGEDSLFSVYGDSVRSLLRETVRGFTVTGEDRRKTT